MAAIQQAAKWLREGHNVQRKSIAGRYYLSPVRPFQYLIFEAICADSGEHRLDCSDLLAEDWEITESQTQDKTVPLSKQD